MPFHDLTEEEIVRIGAHAGRIKEARCAIEKAERHLNFINKEKYPEDGLIKATYHLNGVSGVISIPFETVRSKVRDRLLEAQGDLAKALAEIQVNLKNKTS